MPSRKNAFGCVALISLLIGCSNNKAAQPKPVSCQVEADCPSAQRCVVGTCLKPCAAAAECGTGQRCEGGFCAVAAVGAGNGCQDADSDGFGVGCALGPDCDDQDAMVHQGLPEICGDGKDNDCDGIADGESCRCTWGMERTCYAGPDGTAGKGLCRSGMMACKEDKMFGPCQGEVLPKVEICDGLDNDCDGEVDEGVQNACGKCGPVPPEQCGDGLDNDCDGQVDEDCACDPSCQCSGAGAARNCVCRPPTDQPCYSGQLKTLGMGTCKGGKHSCVLQGASYVWSACVGEVLPALECVGGADGKDNDCDGEVDEGCLPDRDGDGSAPPLDCDDNNPELHPGQVEICNGVDDNCDGLVDEGVQNACGGCGAVPAEQCGDGLDNDCDGQVDEGCGGCGALGEKSCYRGPAGTLGVGQCKAGVMRCPDGEMWTECQGDVRPGIEICDGVDNDCDGEVDERYAVGANACGFCDSVEKCDGLDNDCDGQVDEGLRNACGDCLPVPAETLCDGKDNDCDGLVDEGLLNACGKCPGEPCYQEIWDRPGECAQDYRLCDGTVADPTDPRAITLGEGTLRTPFIYIAVTGKNQVAKLNTETGQKLWQVSSGGTSPSRTAVALDYSVWVANRGFDGTSDPNKSNAVHLDGDGRVLCRVDAVGIARGVAVDGDGNVWVGAYNSGLLYKVSGSAVDNTSCSKAPCCKLLGTVNTGVNIYGLAIDGRGKIWTSSNPTVKVNTKTMQIEGTVNHTGYYGIAIDQSNNVWFGGWLGGVGVNRVDGTTHALFNTAISNVTGVTVDAEGFIWGSSYGSNEVVKLNPTTGALVCKAPIPGASGSNPHGVAIDAAGKVWVPNRVGGYANRFTRNCVLDGTFAVDPGAELYTYSDMTGSQLRLITTREGHWIQSFDSGYGSPRWVRASFDATVVANTTVAVSFRAADTEAGLATASATLCGPFRASPVDLTTCPQIQNKRWLSADAQLTTSQDGFRPTFRNLQLSWSR